MRIVLALCILMLFPSVSHAGVYAHWPNGDPAVRYNIWPKYMKVDPPNARIVMKQNRNIITNCGNLGEVAGCTRSYSDGSIEVEVQWFPKRIYSTKWIYWHELGHVFDVRMMTNYRRAQYMKLIGSTRPWSYYFAERFARNYAGCALFGTNIPVFQSVVESSELRYRATRVRHLSTCRFINRIS